MSGHEGPPGTKLTLEQLAKELEAFLVHEYHLAPHSTTKEPPQARWEKGGFLPQMPDSLEQLDLLLLTVPTTRKVHSDGIQFLEIRYIDPTLAAFVGEQVLLRYDPRDIAEVRVFHHDRFICRAICQELAGQTVALREIVQARNAAAVSCARRSRSVAALSIPSSKRNGGASRRRRPRTRAARRNPQAEAILQ